MSLLLRKSLVLGPARPNPWVAVVVVVGQSAFVSSSSSSFHRRRRHRRGDGDGDGDDSGDTKQQPRGGSIQETTGFGNPVPSWSRCTKTKVGISSVGGGYRSFHTATTSSSSSSSSSTTMRVFDPFRYHSSVALLKQSTQEGNGMSESSSASFVVSPPPDNNNNEPEEEEDELRKWLNEYQQHPKDLNVLEALQQAYSALEYWEEALAVEQYKCDCLGMMSHHNNKHNNNDNDDAHADSIHLQGKLWLRQGNFEQSKLLYEQALYYFQQRHNHVQQGHVLISLAGWYFFHHEEGGRAGRGEQDGGGGETTSSSFLQTAMEYLIQAEMKLDSSPTLLVKCLDNQGLICRLNGDYETALDKYQQALSLVVGDTNHSDNDNDNNNDDNHHDPKRTRHALQMHVADMRLALDEPHVALVLYQELLHEIQQESSSTTTTTTTTRRNTNRRRRKKMDSLGMQGVLWHNIASIHVQLGQWEVAEEGFREALRLKEESAGRDDHPELAKTWNALGALYYGLLEERNHQAMECFRNVLWITRAHSTHADPRTDPDIMAAIQTISDIQEQIDLEKKQQG